jgi:hypothetical protein
MFMFAKGFPHYWDKDAVLIKSEWWPGGRLYRDTDLYMESLNGVIFDPDTTLPLGVVLPTAVGDSEHQARYPTSLVEPWIRLASSERGCCPLCLAPYRRKVEKLREPFPHRRTIGWEPLCMCPPHDPIPCTVLDPFSGSGSTQAAALGLGRDAIYIDQSADYAADARLRLSEMGGNAERPRGKLLAPANPLQTFDVMNDYARSRGWVP